MSQTDAEESNQEDENNNQSVKVSNLFQKMLCYSFKICILNFVCLRILIAQKLNSNI